jgi:predicted nucleotidyltransferase
VDRKKLLRQLKKGVTKFPKIQMAWIYGSFSREDDGPQSDIDIAIKAEEDFSYFDLAEIQYHLESVLKRKIDIGFIDSFKPYIFENLKNDLKLIYER